MVGLFLVQHRLLVALGVAVVTLAVCWLLLGVVWWGSLILSCGLAWVIDQAVWRTVMGGAEQAWRSRPTRRD
jgi:hypothetical protein